MGPGTGDKSPPHWSFQPTAYRPHVPQIPKNVTQHKIMKLFKTMWDFFVLCFNSYYLFIYGYFSSMFVHAPLAWLVPKRPEEGVTGETDGCQLSCGYWELDLVPLEEELGLLTTELSLPSLRYLFCNSIAQFSRANFVVDQVISQDQKAEHT